MKKILLLGIVLMLAGCVNVPTLGHDITLVNDGVYHEMPDSCYQPQDRCFVDPCYPDRLVCVRYQYDKNNQLVMAKPFYREVILDIKDYKTNQLCKYGNVSFSDSCMDSVINIQYQYIENNIIMNYWSIEKHIENGLLYTSF